MFVDVTKVKENKYSVAIIGAGPVGITLALALEERGIPCLLLDSGGKNYSSSIQELSDAGKYNLHFHAPMADATRRQLGGASIIWGGRCVPYDPIDFEKRAYAPGTDWPITYDEIWSYHEKACEYSFCGKSDFDIHSALNATFDGVVPGMQDDDELMTRLERWSLPTNYGKEYSRHLQQSDLIHVLLNATVVRIGLTPDGRLVRNLEVKKSDYTEEDFVVTACRYVLANGGIEATRLLLASNDTAKEGIGNHSGMLGKCYMGHLSGKVARVNFSTASKDTLYGFEKDQDYIYTRRRLTFTSNAQQHNELLNISLWLDNPPIYNPEHGNAILSFAYLALTFPFLCKLLAPDAIRKMAVSGGERYNYLDHVKNLFGNFEELLKFVMTFGWNRYLVRRKVPGFMLPNKKNVYALHYHAEQLPSRASCISLSEKKDRLGMSCVDIDLNYSEKDIDSVLQAHNLLDDKLRKLGVGYLEYAYDDLKSAVREQAGDGFHQIGTTRMADNPNEGVVDQNLKIHGIDGLYVCSSSVFPSSGQANPTLTTIAFGIRLADHIKKTMKR